MGWGGGMGDGEMGKHMGEGERDMAGEVPNCASGSLRLLVHISVH